MNQKFKESHNEKSKVTYLESIKNVNPSVSRGTRYSNLNKSGLNLQKVCNARVYKKTERGRKFLRLLKM